MRVRVRQQVIRLVAARRVESEARNRPCPLAGGSPSCCLSFAAISTRWTGACRCWNNGSAPPRTWPRLDQQITQVRSDKESAIDAQDFEHAAVLRDREQQLLGDKAARQQEWAALPSLTDEVERLRDLLRQHGIDPQDGAA